uniref:Capsid protein n=1 Tax=Tripterygium mastrevirus A TaxID=2809269 RepID=A0A890CB44_9GEMI|nr:putative CP [Tripterygium mastrevirus A]
MASSSRWGGNVYTRKRTTTQRERAEANRQRAIKRRKALEELGVSSWAEAARLMDAPGRSVNVRRPSLQVANFTWSNNKSAQRVNGGGGVYLFSAYPFGSSDYMRHTNETLTYKMSMLVEMKVPDEYYNFVMKTEVCGWIVYDKSPSKDMPTPGSIFDTLYDRWPITWTVSRDVCHRFVVKKFFRIPMSCNGIDPTKASTVAGTPCNNRVGVRKFWKRLGVRTEWSNKGDGGVGDIKSGAMYLVLAPSNGFSVDVYGRFRVYFKSVGNQ